MEEIFGIRFKTNAKESSKSVDTLLDKTDQLSDLTNEIGTLEAKYAAAMVKGKKQQAQAINQQINLKRRGIKQVEQEIKLEKFKSRFTNQQMQSSGSGGSSGGGSLFGFSGGTVGLAAATALIAKQIERFADLQVTSTNTQQKSSSIAGVNALGALFGDDQAGTKLAQASKEAAGKVGRVPLDAEELLLRIAQKADEIKATGNQPALNAFLSQNSVSPALEAILREKNVDQIRAEIEARKASIGVTEETTKKAQLFDQELTKFSQSLGGLLTKTLTPILTEINKQTESDKDGIVGLIPNALGSTVTAIPFYLRDKFRKRLKADTGIDLSPQAQSPELDMSTPQARKDYAYNRLIQDGYTPLQAAADIGNAEREMKNFDPSIKEIGGKGIGYAQWTSKDRIANLKKQGFDPYNYSMKNQMDMHLWEMRKMGIDKKLNQAGNDPRKLSDVFVNDYEMPADRAGGVHKNIENTNRFIRERNISPVGKQSMNNGVSMKVDTVHVHTQATNGDEIAKAFSDHLTKESKKVIAYFDDAVRA